MPLCFWWYLTWLSHLHLHSTAILTSIHLSELTDLQVTALLWKSKLVPPSPWFSWVLEISDTASGRKVFGQNYKEKIRVCQEDIG